MFEIPEILPESIEVIGFNSVGAIDAVLNGLEVVVPDDMANPTRHQIWDEWEMAPADPGTPKEERVRVNTIPPYVPPPDPPAVDLPLTKRQVIAAMIIGGSILDPDGAVTAAIGAIADPVARALALNDWRNAPYYLRAHPLFNDADLLAAMGLNSAAIDGLWALAVQQPK